MEQTKGKIDGMQLAYPLEEYAGCGRIHLGVSKREYFAAHALSGILSNPNGVMYEGGSWSHHPDVFAEMAVKYADALLEELSK